MSGRDKQRPGAAKAVQKRKSKAVSNHSNRVGAFKPTVSIPRMLPVASPPTNCSIPTSTQVTKPDGFVMVPPVRASEAGLLERVGHEADEALAIGKRVLTMLNVESKEVNVTFNSSIDWNGAWLQPMTGITQGDTDSQRDGDSFKLKSWKGGLAFTRGTADSVFTYAFVQEGPTFLTANSQVFEAVATLVAPLSDPAWDSRLGFRLLRKGTFALTANNPCHVVRFDHEFNHDVQYYNNSTTVYEGKVSMFMISDDSGGGTAPTARMSSQLVWVDN